MRAILSHRKRVSDYLAIGRTEVSMFRSVIFLTVAVLLSPMIASAGPYTLLHVFQSNPQPSSSVVFDAKGNAYGTTGYGGGQNNAGTVYQFSPTSGYHTIYSFNGNDGSQPFGGLAADSAGNLYGTTASGGAFTCSDNSGCGTVFRLSPPSNGGVWTETTLYNFSGGDDGFLPAFGVILDAKGNLYGAANQGGTFQCGLVFELSPFGNDQWIKQTLYDFGDDGCSPESDVTFDSAGNLYGTTILGGMWNAGTIFQLSPSPGGSWSYSAIHEFNPNVKDGFRPEGGVIFDSAGNLYGTTSGGGDTGWGAVFELTPDEGSWTENILYSFAGGNDGAVPIYDLVFDTLGNLFGTTNNGGGSKGYGTLFRLTPNQDGTWTERSFSMGNGPRGVNPIGPLLLDGKGHAYGTTSDGGRNKNGQIGHGVVFRLNIGNSGQ